jgi:hypothetical protein
MTPEARARQDIDRLLSLAGWHICSISHANVKRLRSTIKRYKPPILKYTVVGSLLSLEAELARSDGRIRNRRAAFVVDS